MGHNVAKAISQDGNLASLWKQTLRRKDEINKTVKRFHV